MNAIRFYRERKILTQPKLAKKIGVSIATLWRWENNQREPRASDIQKLCRVLGASEEELLNGPWINDIDVRVFVRNTLERTGNLSMDFSKDARFLQIVEIGEHKTGLSLTFGPGKSLREVCTELLEHEQKIEAARAAIYGDEFYSAKR